jgi:hypothetical protein
VAGRFQGLWFHALIEEINFKCDDLAMFFVDYGSRKSTTVLPIRLLGRRMSNLSAHAARYAQSDSKTFMSRRESKFVNVRVDCADLGGVADRMAKSTPPDQRLLM